jgi:hypothetical protein
MVGLGWSMSVVMQEHLQNLMSLGYMIAAKLATCRVPEDPTSHVPTGGYVVACTAFYERGFGVPSHRFLRSLLQFYGLELYHMTRSGILHMAAFMTLCEAYMGIEPHFNLWNYFFCTRLQQGSDAKTAMFGPVDIYVRSGPEVDPYFLISMPDPLVGWRRAWFLLRDDADAPLPLFTGSHPVPHPNWGYGVAQTNLSRLQPLLEAVQGLLQRGLMGVEILRIIFSHGAEPLCH